MKYDIVRRKRRLLSYWVAPLLRRLLIMEEEKGELTWLITMMKLYARKQS